MSTLETNGMIARVLSHFHRASSNNLRRNATLFPGITASSGIPTKLAFSNTFQSSPGLSLSSFKEPMYEENACPEWILDIPRSIISTHLAIHPCSVSKPLQHRDPSESRGKEEDTGYTGYPGYNTTLDPYIFSKYSCMSCATSTTVLLQLAGIFHSSSNSTR